MVRPPSAAEARSSGCRTMAAFRSSKPAAPRSTKQVPRVAGDGEGVPGNRNRFAVNVGVVPDRVVAPPASQGGYPPIARPSVRGNQARSGRPAEARILTPSS